jgi:hypothetical protein
MSEQCFYVLLKFMPKFCIVSVPNTKQQEAAMEIPKYLVQRKQSELINEREKRQSPSILLEELLSLYLRTARNRLYGRMMKKRCDVRIVIPS